MEVINIYEAKTHFSQLINKALIGEEVVIAKAGKPLVKLVPYCDRENNRVPGSAKGKIEIADDFDAPLPEDVENSFYQ